MQTRSRRRALGRRLPSLALLLLALAPAPLLAQGSALDYMSDADTKRMASPRDQAARALGRGERYLRKADELAAEAKAKPSDVRLLRRAGDSYGRAVRELRTATTKDPTLREAHLLMGRAYLGLGDPEKAIGACRAAWSLDHARPDAPLCEIAAHLALNHPRPAQEAFLLLRQEAPTATPEALRLLRQWAEERPDDPQAGPLLAWVKEQGG